MVNLIILHRNLGCKVLVELAREVGSRNITVNTVSPGFIETDMTSQLPEEGKNNARKYHWEEGISQEVACVVKFLASSSGDYITGKLFTLMVVFI